MRIIDQSAELVQPTGDYKKDIEKAARVSYKSEHLITEGSAEKMFDRLVKAGHTSCLEFGTIYLQVPIDVEAVTGYSGYGWNRILLHDGYWYITTNARHVQEHNLWSDVEKYSCKPTKFHAIRKTLKLITNRSTSHELVRHRVFSFCQESQRYCNYSKDKFNGEVTYIRPTWLDIPTGQYGYWDGVWFDHVAFKTLLKDADKATPTNEFLWSLDTAELRYNAFIAQGWTPQQARTLLPNATKTELFMCGFEDDWEQFLKLRDSKTADPMMQDLAKMIKQCLTPKTND